MRKLILTGLLLKIILLAQAQMFSATFEYDENGNRINAEVIYLSKSEQISEEPKELVEITDDFVVKVFPNPTSGLIIIEVTDTKKEALKTGYIEVFDISGKMILQISDLKDSSVINLDAKPDGIYLIRMRVGDYRKTYKVIKN